MSATLNSNLAPNVYQRPAWIAAPGQREAAIVRFGYTERQARFLATVMLHGGVCVCLLYTSPSPRD